MNIEPRPEPRVCNRIDPTQPIPTGLKEQPLKPSTKSHDVNRKNLMYLVMNNTVETEATFVSETRAWSARRPASTLRRSPTSRSRTPSA